MANVATNVTAGKPAVAGAVFRAVLSANLTIPTSATATLSADYKALGYVSEDGLTNSNSPDTDIIKAWGGDPVLPIQNGKEDTFQMTLIEVLNADVLKAVYGTANVTGTIDSGITVKANSAEAEEACWVIDMVLRGGVLKRVVIPDGKITEIGDIEYTDEDAVGYEITVSASPDSAGQTHYEYIAKPATTTT
jgi:hypothetical protein